MSKRPTPRRSCCSPATIGWSISAGHFLTIDPHQFEALERFTAFLEDLKGRKEPPRAYSMSSAPHERYLAVTVKEERYVSGQTKYPPLLSPLLVKRTVAGMRLEVTGFTGPYTLPDDVEPDRPHRPRCAGSGSVPNFSILKSALEHHPKLRHTFIYSNKTWDDVIFRDALGVLAEKHPDRLKVVHTLTREGRAFARGPFVRKGRIEQPLLQEFIRAQPSRWSTSAGLGSRPGISWPPGRREPRRSRSFSKPSWRR